MKTPTLLPVRGLSAAIALSAAAASAQDGPILYASEDPRIAEIREGVDNGSQESQRIERALVGDWVYRHEVARADVGFRWTSLRIQAEGTLVMEYRTNGTDTVQTLAGPFDFIHKGTDQQQPGRRPAVLVAVEPAALGFVLPLVELTVDYDSRAPVNWGMVLKFRDLEGNEFVFSSLDPFRDWYRFDTWAGQTKLRYERAVTNWVPDFASLGVTNFVGRYEGTWTHFRKFSDYAFESVGTPGAEVHLRIWERQDVATAHLAMLDYFATSAAPAPFPLGSACGVEVGDRCYLGWGVVGDSVQFVRNNVFVSLSAADHSVLGLAGRLDGELVLHSFRGPVLLPAAIHGGAFHVSVPTAAGKTYVLEYKDSLSGTNWSALPPLTGDGTIWLITHPARSPQQFFRLRVQQD